MQHRSEAPPPFFRALLRASAALRAAGAFQDWPVVLHSTGKHFFLAVLELPEGSPMVLLAEELITSQP